MKSLFIDEMPLQMLKKLVEREIMVSTKSVNIEIKGFEFGEDCYFYRDENGEPEGCYEDIYATVVENGKETSKWYLQWDCESQMFITVMKENQKKGE